MYRTERTSPAKPAQSPAYMLIPCSSFVTLKLSCRVWWRTPMNNSTQRQLTSRNLQSTIFISTNAKSKIHIVIFLPSLSFMFTPFICHTIIIFTLPSRYLSIMRDKPWSWAFYPQDVCLERQSRILSILPSRFPSWETISYIISIAFYPQDNCLEWQSLILNILPSR